MNLIYREGQIDCISDLIVVKWTIRFGLQLWINFF